eukprot:TRINITY_DN3693_c0_g1_i1.p1 TRINITY_DN3693_c0_g1~~TRINITY_DN3693_c0_g1_i1.p1  ORF type:complete len:294 (+),score=52.03 TRINITY_DN3693_c0_g1_i1:480-1361(+)
MLMSLVQSMKSKQVFMRTSLPRRLSCVQRRVLSESFTAIRNFSLRKSMKECIVNTQRENSIVNENIIIERNAKTKFLASALLFNVLNDSLSARQLRGLGFGAVRAHAEEAKREDALFLQRERLNASHFNARFSTASFLLNRFTKKHVKSLMRQVLKRIVSFAYSNNPNSTQVLLLNDSFSQGNSFLMDHGAIDNSQMTLNNTSSLLYQNDKENQHPFPRASSRAKRLYRPLPPSSANVSMVHEDVSVLNISTRSPLSKSLLSPNSQKKKWAKGTLRTEKSLLNRFEMTGTNEM